jgi:DNA-binding transcriptional LysR family regulator
METDRLRYFCAIYETGSYAKASELLRISHGGLSKAMSVLQEELGVTLFRPAGRGIELTDSAHEIYKRSQDVLKLVSALAETEPVAQGKQVSIGLAEIFSYSLTKKLPDLFSETELSVHELDAGEIEVCLLDKRIDFGISFVPFPRPELEYLKVTEASFGAYQRMGSFDQLPSEKIPFVVPTTFLPSNPLSLKIRDGWPAGLSRETPFRASSLTLALELAYSGQAAIFIPHFLAAALNRGRAKDSLLQEISYPAGTFAKSKREIYIVKKKNAEESSAIKAVARLLRLTCKEL